MVKEIDFRYGDFKRPKLIDFVCLSGRQDSDFVLQWLIQCEFRIQLRNQRRPLEVLLWLNLTKCNSRSRDKVLVTLSLLGITHRLDLWIEVYGHDSLSTIELLPNNIVDLSIFIQNNFPLTLVPDIVRALKKLESLHMSGFSNGWSFRMSCLKDELRFPDHMIIRGDALTKVSLPFFNFSLGKGWTIIKGTKSYKIVEVAPNWDYRELETEVRWLCSLSPTLNEVGFF
jgi:hypothetical protein